MTEVGSAYVSILPSTKGFAGRLSRDLSGPSTRAGQDAGRSAGQGFSRGLLPSMRGIASAAGGILGGAALFKLGSLGVSTAASMEQAKIAFTTMLGSAQKAGAFLQDLQAFAAKTPFEFPELQTAASSLISIGVNAKDVIPIMTTLGNVTSGMGTGSQGVQRATVALQQMIAAQRITGEDLNQLRDAGIPVYDLLSKATGKSTAEVLKMAQAGKLGKKELDAMLDALKSGKGLERFAGLMDKQSQSLTGLWSTFKDTLGQGLAKLITPAIPGMKRALGAVSSSLGDFFTGISGSFEEIQKHRTIFTDLGLGVSALVAAFKDGDVTSNGLVGAFERIGVVARDVVRGFRSTVLPALKDLWSTLQPLLVEALEVVMGAFRSLTGQGGQFGAMIRGVTGFLKAHKTIVQAVGVGILAAVAAYKTWMIVSRAFAAVQAAVNVVLAANPIGLVVIAIAALAAGLIYAYKHSETFRNVVDSAFRVVGRAVDFVKDHWRLFALAFAPLLTAVITGVQLLVRHFDTLKAIAARAFGAVGNAAQGMWNNAVRPAFRFIASTWLTVVGTLVHGAAKAFGWVPGLGPKLKDAAKAFDRFRDEVNASLDGINTDVKITVTALFRDPAHGDSDYGYASGTNWAAPGWAWVGEQGPELLKFRGGEQVVPNGRLGSFQPAAAGTGGLTIEQLNVTPGPNERAEESVPRGLRNLLWVQGLR